MAAQVQLPAMHEGNLTPGGAGSLGSGRRPGLPRGCVLCLRNDGAGRPPGRGVSLPQPLIRDQGGSLRSGTHLYLKSERFPKTVTSLFSYSLLTPSK